MDSPMDLSRYVQCFRNFGIQDEARGQMIGYILTQLDNLQRANQEKCKDYNHEVDVLIAVMGTTGAGKTTFVNKITNLATEIGHSLKSCTKEIHVATMQIDGRNVHLIDTPGFDDTELEDSDILMRIAGYLGPSIRLSGIFHLHPVNSRRMGGVATRNLELFRNMVGQDNMRNIKLITKMWNDVEHAQGEKHLEELTRDFWNETVAAGAQVDRCRDAAQDGLRIIQSVLRTSPVTLQLQRGMEAGCGLAETTAGKSLMDRYDELQERYHTDMNVLREQLAKASTDRDRQAELERSHADKLQKQVDVAEQARKLLEADVKKLQEEVTRLSKSTWSRTVQ
ncbi:hypothetical protein COL922a_012073 [Colletotrichum nupharicola]|nr:hypothetical protein COL922a_012073 [Colletotrichum nupharicola]